MTLLSGFRVVQLGGGPAAAVCGRLFADAGAEVRAFMPKMQSPAEQWLNHGKSHSDTDTSLADLLACSHLVVAEGGPSALGRQGWDEHSLRSATPDAALVLISPYGQTGPGADEPASDLTLMAASGIMRMLTGQVDDLSEPPVRATGEQSAIIGGLAAACAGMHAALSGPEPAIVDVSIQEALATLAMTELARAGQTGKSWQRLRQADGNGATVCILPARDGYAAISPREEKQWAAWLAAMGSPAWGGEPKFATKADRMANWDELHALMSEWSRTHYKQWIADTAQAAHVPSFPLREPSEQLDSPQLVHRGFFRMIELEGQTVKAPGPSFRLHFTESEAPPLLPSNAERLPLHGVRVLDFSWVIAGPTATRHLASMGAEVIKIEAPGRGDPGRGSELHTVLGQAKKGVVLNLKKPEAIEIAKGLAARSDILIENFATGVMERLGLGAKELQRLNPNLIYLSASGLGRTGPEAGAVAYGTLLQCYAGFAGLNRHPERPPRVGMAWLDPLCGLILPFLAAASIWRQRHAHGQGIRADFSMIEAMLWSMAGPLLDAQLGVPPQPKGNRSERYAPHGVYPCAGEDAWMALAVRSTEEWQRLCEIVPGLASQSDFNFEQRQQHAAVIDAALASWTAPQGAADAARRLTTEGIAAAAVASSTDLVTSTHLRVRGFWKGYGYGLLPGLPWHPSFGHQAGEAPRLGAHTDEVLREVLDMEPAEITKLRSRGVFD